MKLTKNVLANSFALTAGLFWIIIAVIVNIFPFYAIRIGKYASFGLPIQKLGDFEITLFGFIAGGLFYTIAGWVFGYLLGQSIQYFTSKKT